MEKSSERLSKLHSMSAEDRFERKRIFLSKNLFSMFCGFGSNISWTFGQNILVRWPNWRWKSPGEHFENNVFFEKNLLFQTLRQKRSEKGKVFRLRSLNCIIRDQKNILRKFFLRFEDLFFQFRTFSKNTLKLLSKLLSMSPEDRFGKKLFFQHRGFFRRLLDLQPIFLRLRLIKFRVVRQNYIFTLPKKRFFEEEHFLEKLIDFFSNSDRELKRFWLL